MKQRAPALPDSPTFQQLWDTLGSKLIESAREHLLYTYEIGFQTASIFSSPDLVKPSPQFFCFSKNLESSMFSLHPHKG